MVSSYQPQKRSGPGVLSILLAVVLIGLIVAAVIIGRGGGKQVISTGGTTTVRVVAGSEKIPYFQDPDVVKRLDELGLKVEATSSGSRKIATRSDLKEFDAAFPSSAPAAEKISRETQPKGIYSPFHSPMAVATFDPILGSLEKQQVAMQRDGVWYLNVEKYLELASSGKRWRDIAPEFPSPLAVQISSTDIRSSNSAAMYLSVAAWVANGGNVPATDQEVSKVVNKVSPLFTHQGFTGGSSAGPFAEYLTQGMGARPMVLIYEAQFIGQQISAPNTVGQNMKLMYLDPTISSQHTLLAYSDGGDKLGEALATDATLQRLAAEHGFRPNSPGVFNEVLKDKGMATPPEFLATINPPDFDRLEQLIEGVSAQYNGSAPPEGAPEQ
ncbi:hypothetical protein CKALI_05205 [Corynebacterium kalinowskii]|uniref:Uncharacterized protein n=1 Tax=Corynebacterium kalinowskii TaxID=2675216 RepID=A0A6B8VSE2_9CORY|nr:hypothetical protein [Corynebacterium kalinowskii]QGU01915.1 hypothetical protein CKALI_05205 [Corynebacterium kalinowskii]